MAFAPPRLPVLLLALLFLPSTTAAANSRPSDTDTDVKLDVDWPSFLSRHDLTWEWVWGGGAIYTIQPSFGELNHCGAAGAAGTCCLTGASSESGPVTLALCASTSTAPGVLAQRWHLARNGSVINVASGSCLTASTSASLSGTGSSNASVSTAPCSAAAPGQAWGQYEGFWTPTPPKSAMAKNAERGAKDGPGGDGKCLQIGVTSPFCDGTVCPKAFAQPLTAGLVLELQVRREKLRKRGRGVGGR